MAIVITLEYMRPVAASVLCVLIVLDCCEVWRKREREISTFMEIYREEGKKRKQNVLPGIWFEVKSNHSNDSVNLI